MRRTAMAGLWIALVIGVMWSPPTTAPVSDAAAATGTPPCFTSTLVIGYSQVGSRRGGWFVVDDAFLSQVDADRWQLLWAGGAGVDRWRHPDYDGWRRELVSPAKHDADAPQRIVLSISGPFGDDERRWAEAIELTIAVIAGKYPSARQIVLQPVVGGPGGQTCHVSAERGDKGDRDRRRVRASWQHKHIVHAIERVVEAHAADRQADDADERPVQVVAGYAPQVRSCDDYSDALGHLTQEGAAAAGEAIGRYYAERDAACLEAGHPDCGLGRDDDQTEASQMTGEAVADSEAWLFDGRSTGVLVPETGPLVQLTADRQLTVSAKVNTASSRRQALVAKRGATESWTPHFLLELNRHEAGEIRFSIDDAARRAEILHAGMDGRWGEWVMLTAVWDADRLHLYIDGEHAASADAAEVDGWPNAGSRLSLGVHHRDDGARSGYLEGSLRDVRLYDRALDADEVRRLTEDADVRNGLIAHWPMRRAVFDKTEHAHYGRLIGQAGADPSVAVADEPPGEPNVAELYRVLFSVRTERLNDSEPIIMREHFERAGAAGREGTNINGPSVIRVPDWIPHHERPAEDAEYYMYFAHHGGRYIRMAYADDPVGPWHLFNTGDAVETSLGDPERDIPPRQTPGRGVVDLDLGETDRIETGSFHAHHHVASPDVRIDHDNERLVMYLHAPSSTGGQQTFVTTSRYGLNFNNADDGGERFEGERHGFRDVIPGIFYFRTFEVAGRTFAYANLAQLYRAPARTTSGEPATLTNADNLGGLWHPTPEDDRSAYWQVIDDEANPIRQIYSDMGRVPEDDRYGGIWDPRHFAVLHDPKVDPDRIFVLYSASGDEPERILMTVLDLTGLSEAERHDPANWSIVDPQQQTVLEPRQPWEGADLPLQESRKGAATGVRELRDPFLFRDDDGCIYLYYAGRGEEAIGVAAFEILR